MRSYLMFGLNQVKCQYCNWSDGYVCKHRNIIKHRGLIGIGKFSAAKEIDI